MYLILALFEAGFYQMQTVTGEYMELILKVMPEPTNRGMWKNNGNGRKPVRCSIERLLLWQQGLNPMRLYDRLGVYLRIITPYIHHSSHPSIAREPQRLGMRMYWEWQASRGHGETLRAYATHQVVVKPRLVELRKQNRVKP